MERDDILILYVENLACRIFLGVVHKKKKYYSSRVLETIVSDTPVHISTLCPAQTPNLVSLSLPISSQIPF